MRADADNGADEVGCEESEKDVAHAEPAQRQSKHRCQSDITKAEHAWTYGIHSEEDQEPCHRTDTSDEQEMPMMGGARCKDEECRHENQDRIDNPLRKQEMFEVGRGQRQQPCCQYEIGGQTPRERKTCCHSREEGRRRCFNQWIAC